MFGKSEKPQNGLDNLINLSKEIQEKLKKDKAEIVELEKQLKQKRTEQDKTRKTASVLKRLFKLKAKNMKAEIPPLRKLMETLNEKPA